jgi:predicted GH43/DUF377 family glycosyl hydrolase
MKEGRGRQKYLFDPSEGRTVIEPPARGRGNWVGGTSAVYLASEKLFYLYYRIRTRRERAKHCYIARSLDGVRFENIWHADADQLGALSIERAAFFPAPGGGFLLYLSYDIGNNVWRIDRLSAETPASFEVAKRENAFDPKGIFVQYVKDPYVARVGSAFYMYIHTRRLDNVKVTNLATSEDGVSWRWQGEVLRPGLQWDNYCARITSAVKTNDEWLVFYDGAEKEEHNCEEKTGILVSGDMKRFERRSVDGPALTSPHASGALRYVDALRVEDRVYCYYEYTRADGSHELRLNVL